MHVYIFVQLQGEHMIQYTYHIYHINNIQSAFVLMIIYIIFFKVIYMDMSKRIMIYKYPSLAQQPPQQL